MNRIRLCALLFAVLVLFAAQTPTTAQASTLTYDVTLSALAGSQGGGGTFSITVPSSGSGVLTDNNGLTSLSVNVGPATFGITNSAVSYLYIGSTFVLTGLSGTDGVDALYSLTFGNGGVYSLIDTANSSLISSGLVSIAQAPVSQTPLPTSLPLLATGLIVLALLGWNRKRKVGSYLSA